MLQTGEAQADLVSITEDARRVCHEPDFGIPLGPAGNDSFVRQVGPLVYKKYTGDNLIYMTGGDVYPKIARYRDVMNMGAAFAERENWTIEFPSLGDPFPLRVNPFPNIVRCPECTSVIGVVPTVYGDNLRKIQVVGEQELEEVLAAKSKWIGERLRAEGIRLYPDNLMKVDMEPESMFVITDLASIIGLIK